MANVDRLAVPVLASELSDLIAELHKPYKFVYLTLEVYPPGSTMPGLCLALQCFNDLKPSPGAHYRSFHPFLGDRPVALSEAAYGLLWGAIDDAMAKGLLPQWGDDPS